MDRFGLGYVAVLILLLLASSLLWPLASGPGEPSAPRVHTRDPLAGSPVRFAAPVSGSSATTAAVLHSDGRSYRVLVGRDAAGRTWSAAFAVSD